uniref:TPR_REGION domain-containing protein n=3 Tax=Mesocestoides corti TaxID=53468 RepID=A0A5K3EYR9_MESCO
MKAPTPVWRKSANVEGILKRLEMADDSDLLTPDQLLGFPRDSHSALALQQLALVYEKLKDTSAAAKRKAYDQATRAMADVKLTKQRKQRVDTPHVTIESEGTTSDEAPLQWVRGFEEGRRSKVEASPRVTPLITKQRRLTATKQIQASRKPPVKLPPLVAKTDITLKETAAVHEALPDDHLFEGEKYEKRKSKHVGSRNVRTALLRSGRLKLPSLFPAPGIKRQYTSADYGGISSARVETIAPVDMTLHVIPPIRSARAQTRLEAEGASGVDLINPVVLTVCETPTTVPVITERLAGANQRRVTMFLRGRKQNVSEDGPTTSKFSKTPRTLPAVKVDAPEKTSQERQTPPEHFSHKKVPKVRTNHRLVTEDIRMELLLKMMRTQLKTRDLIEVMIDLHTGQPSKKTKQVVKEGYEMLKDQKYTSLDDETPEKCRIQLRPPCVPFADWRRIGASAARAQIANPADEFAYPGCYSVPDSHCEQSKIAEIGGFRNELNFKHISRRSNIVGRVLNFIQERVLKQSSLRWRTRKSSRMCE